MTAERWQQIESLYHLALEHPFAERRVFVAGICNGDGELQREIESLLASQETAGDFIEEPITGAAARVLSIQQTRMLISREISHYKILSLLGAGGMGEVYLAEDTALYRKVALKLFHSHLARDNEIHERFMREARLAASLDHPNICTVYEVGETEGRPFIAMRHVQGKTLKDLIAGQPLALESLFSISLQVADALAAAHSRGIIHRDIKAENIMVASDGRVQVLDFGIAKLLEKEEQDTRLTTGGRAMGTPAVMSPEQARGERVDARTDIFSFGVVIYEMATGRLPFIGKSQADIISALLKEGQTPAAKINKKITRQLSAVIGRALEKEPDRRHCSMEAMISALQEAKTDSHGDHRLGATIFHRVHKGLATAILVTVAVVAAGVMYYFWPQHGASHVRSIAILPFKPLTAESRNESLEMGMADTLITRLSNLRQLAVRPMSSVRRYAAAEQDPIAAGREQRVDAVLDGSIQKSGERIRVTVRLISLTDGHQLWADKFEEQFRDIFSVEDSISERVAAALSPTLSRQEKKELAKHYTDNPEAHELYLKGRFFWNKRTPDNFQNAISYFRRAVDKDPNYALAYSGLADAYCLLGPYGGSPPNETMPKAKAAALKALELDDNLAEAHASLALILDYYDWDYSGALREVDRAIQLNPNYATAHQWRGEFLMALARHDEAIGEIRRALELDPLSLIINRVLGDAYYFARRYDEAVDQFRKTIDMDPNFRTAYWFLAAAYECKGMYQDAVVEGTKEVELGGDKEDAAAAAAMRKAYANGGWNGYWQYVLASLKESASQKFVHPSSIARACAEVGEKDEAFAWLQKAYQERDYQMTLLKVNPLFDSLRSDPRFNDLLRRVNLAP
jgi:eukaryotic-like serine/threonine-protein kinase